MMAASSALATWGTEKIQNHWVRECSHDGLYSSDPYRFSLSQSEISNLEKKGYDVIKVKCAIIELVSQIKEYSKDREPSWTDSGHIPSFFSRTSEPIKQVDSCIQDNLVQIRKLREGRLDKPIVLKNGVFFDCRQSLSLSKKLNDVVILCPPRGDKKASIFYNTSKKSNENESVLDIELPLLKPS